ncbi:MAG: hypothetical protein QGG21_00005, partial [Candidatus Thalassarchaeaceae archaeon]|nr:hypothetical protein [Candidatus Thalassarchaeaceae archaeon]
MLSVSRRQTLTAMLLATLMVSAPLLAIQTAKLSQSSELDDPNGASMTGTDPDCDENDITISEAYPGSSGWIELYNSGSTCDLGGWHLADKDQHLGGGDGSELSDGTAIGGTDYLQLSYSDDFSFYIDSDEEWLYLAARDVDAADADLAVWWDEDSRDGHDWGSGRDGSWEKCGNEYDWNEPNETTPGSTNLCNGEPIVLRALHGSGEDDPDSVHNETAELAWNTDNLVAGETYEIQYSWETEFASLSDSETFDADGSEIPFSMTSMPDYTCFVRVSAELRDSSGQVIEYYDRELEVDSCIDTTRIQLWDVSTDPNTPIHNPSSRAQHAERCIPMCPAPDVNGDGVPEVDGTAEMMFKLKNPVLGLTYNVLIFAFSDDEVVNLFDDTFAAVNTWDSDTDDYTGDPADHRVDWDWDIAGHECDLRVTIEVSLVVNTILWARSHLYEYDLRPACDGTTGDPIEIITLEAKNSSTGAWEEPPDTLEIGEQQFRWDLGTSTEDQKVRFLYYYYSPTTDYDRAYENRRLLNDDYLYWDLTVDEFGSSRYIEAWFYHVSVTSIETLTDYYYYDFTVNNSIDGGDAVSYAFEDGNSTEELANGTTQMVWNLTELVPGYDYMMEWVTKVDHKYRHYEIIEWVPQSDAELHYWNLTRDGAVCDADVFAYLYVKTANQDWHQADRENWYRVDSYSRYYDPSCSGDAEEYEAATLMMMENYVNWTITLSETGSNGGESAIVEDASGNEVCSLNVSTSSDSCSVTTGDISVYMTYLSYESFMDDDPSLTVEVDGTTIATYDFNINGGSGEYNPSGEISSQSLLGTFLASDYPSWVEVPDSLEPGRYQMRWDLDLDEGTPYYLYQYARLPYYGGTNCHYWKQDTSDYSSDNCYRLGWNDWGATNRGDNRRFLGGEDDGFHWNMTVNSFACDIYTHYYIQFDGKKGDWTIESEGRNIDVIGRPSGCDAGYQAGSQEGSAYYDSTLSAGGDHACAILGNGSVNCWGSNADGQLSVDPHSHGAAWSFACAEASADENGSSYTILVYGNESGDLLGACSNSANPYGNGTSPPTEYANLTDAGDVDVYCYLDAPLTSDDGLGSTGDNTVTMGANVSVNGTALFAWDTCSTSANETSPELLQQLEAWEHGGGNGTDQSSSPTHVELPARHLGDYHYENSARDVSSGGEHTCAILYNGSVGCWGSNAYGQLGNDSVSDSWEVILADIPPQLDAVALSSGLHHTCAALDDGSVRCWGDNTYGQLGDGTTDSSTTPVTVGLPSGRSAIAVAAGYSHSCAVLDNGSVACWGQNGYGQLGDGSTDSSHSPVTAAMPGEANATAVVIGYQSLDSHTCAMLDDGSMACWGFNGHGQLGDNATTSRASPAVSTVLGDANVVAISAGGSHTCAVLDDGAAGCWGDNTFSQTGAPVSAPSTSLSNVSLPSGTTAVAVSAGWGHTCAMLANSTVACWGDNHFSQLGGSSLGNSTDPVSVGLPSSTDGGDIDPDRDAIITQFDEDPLNYELPETADDSEIEMMRSNSTWTTLEHNGFGMTISGGDYHSCMILENGSAVCWGRNSDDIEDGEGHSGGQLGDGTTTDSLTPVFVALPSGRTAVSVDAQLHTCAVLDNGSVSCWGYNNNGQLGDGSTTSSPTPVFVALPSGRTAVAVSVAAEAGSYETSHTCAILDNGSVSCWGANDEGQLGDGTTTSTTTPVFATLPSGGTAVAISAGTQHTCAVLDDGSVACWGYNNYGQLGDGSSSDSLVSLPSGSLATSVSAGHQHTCAVLDNGSVYCWGENMEGQLGDGSSYEVDGTISSSTPVNVALPSGRSATAVSAGGSHTCAVLDDGSVDCWGRNHKGQLGDGTNTDSPTPVSVSLPSGRTAVAVSANHGHTCAILDNGSASCWGYNYFGQVGDGTTGESESSENDNPTPVFVILPSGSSAAIPGFDEIEHYSSTVEDLDDVDEIIEGTTTLRWKAVDVEEHFDYFVHLRLYYNNYLQDFHISRFYTHSDEPVTGEWAFELEGDICNLRVYSELWVDNPGGWQRIDYLEEYLDYAGGDDCYYHKENKFRLFALQSDDTWEEDPDSLQQGDNHVYFETEGLNLKEGVEYYIRAYFEGEGTGNVYNSHTFYLGDEPSRDRHFSDDYAGEDLHLNFTMYDWTCESNVKAYLDYRTPAHHGYRIADYQDSRGEFDVAQCDSAGEVYFNKQDSSGEWSEGYSGWEIEEGTSQLGWNLTDLDFGENYKLTFYVNVDHAYAYHALTVEFTPYGEEATFPFPLTIDEHVCYVYGWASLHIEVPDHDTGFYDGDFQEVDTTTFHADEPCIPYFDILAQDSEGEWQDTMEGYLLSNNTTQMLFDLSDLNEDDYYIGYSWNTPSNSSGWVYDYVEVDGSGTDGLYWNITMLDDDCSANLDIAFYEVDYWGNNDHIQSYDLDLPGPCILPFTLAAYQGGEWVQDPEAITAGSNLMMWNLSNLVDGQDYYFNWYYTNEVDSWGWNNTQFNYSGQNLEFNLPASQWSCSARLYAEIDLITNGSNSRIRDQWFTLPVTDCVDGGDISLSANMPYGWDDTPPDYALDNGTTELKWALSDMEVGYSYTFEWLIWMNDQIVSYEYRQGSWGEDNELEWEVYVDENVTCNIRIHGRLLVDVGSDNWKQVETFNDYFYPDCSDSADFHPIEVLTLQDDGSWAEDDELASGNNTFRFDFSDLSQSVQHRLYYSITTTQGGYSSWNTFTPSETSEIDLLIELSPWDCDLTLYYRMDIYSIVSGSWFMGHYYDYYDGPCISDSEVELERYDGTEWDDDPDPEDLDDGTNQMMWNLTGLAVGYEYALEWFVRNNDQYVDHEHVIWNATSTEDSIYWNLTIDEQGVCSVYLWSRLYMRDGSSDWMEFDFVDQTFSPSCESEQLFDHVSLWAKLNGSWVQDPDWLPTGDTEMYWDTSNLISGSNHNLGWSWSTDDGGDSNSENFDADGSQQFNWTLSSNMWSCQAYVSFYVYLYSPIVSNYWIDGGDFYIGTECVDVDYNWSIDPSTQVLAQLDGSNWSTVNDSTTFGSQDIQMSVSLTDLQDQFPYYGELTAYRDGSLHYFHSDYWFADGANASMDWVLDLDAAACELDIRYDLYVDTSTTDWTSVIDIDLEDLGGDCDGTGDDPDAKFSLQAYQNGSWESDADGDITLDNGTTQMRWVSDSLNSDQDYYVYFHNGVNQGYSHSVSDVDEFYWNFTIDEFVCDPNPYIRVAAISDFTGWNYFDNEYHHTQTECADGGNLSGHAYHDGDWVEDPDHIDPGANQMSWNMSVLIPGYDYQLQWQVYSGLSSGWTYHWHNWTAASDEYDFGWTLNVDETECDLYYYGYLSVNSSIYGWMQLETLQTYPEEPCQAPYGIDAHADSGVTEDVTSLDSGTTQMHFDFADLGAGNTYYMGYYWSTDSTSQGWYYEYVTVDSSGGGLWWNITLEETDCKVQIQTSLSNYTNGNNQYIADYEHELDGPCLLPFELTVGDSGAYGASENLSVGANDMLWQFANLDDGSEYYFEYYWASVSDWNGWYSESFTINDSNMSAGYYHWIYWQTDVFEFDCYVNVFAKIYNTTDGNWDELYEENYQFGVPGCSDPDLDIWTEGDDLENGSNSMSLNITALPNDYNYIIEWYVERNGYKTDYAYLDIGNGTTADDSFAWNLTVDNSTTCDVHIYAYLYVTDGSEDEHGNEIWENIEGQSRSYGLNCSQSVNYHPLSLWADVNGSMSQDPDYIGPGDTDVHWDTSNLTDGQEYHVSWNWNSEDFDGDSDSLTFVADGTTIDFQVSVAPWSCEVYFYYSIHFVTFQGDHSWMSSESLYIDAPCSDADYDPADPPDIEVQGLFDGTWSEVNNSTALDAGATQFVLNISGLEDGFPYYSQVRAYYDGHLNVFQSSTWFADSDSDSEYWNLTLEGHECDIDIQIEIHVNTNDAGWQQASELDLELDGPCDGTDGDSVFRVPLYADHPSNGTWTLVDDDTNFSNGTTAMLWDMSVFDDDTRYYFHFHAEGQHIYGGYTDEMDGNDLFEDGYWNFTIDRFNCELEIWLEIAAVSDVTGWHDFTRNDLSPDNIDCVDGGDISLVVYDPNDMGDYSNYEDDDFLELEAGTIPLDWRLTGLEPGYNYTLQWHYYVDGDWQGYTTREWYATHTNATEEWNITIDEHACDLSLHATLSVDRVTGDHQVEYFSIHPDAPCEAPFDLDAHHANGTVSEDAASLPAGTTQMHFDFGGTGANTSYYVGYHWSTDSESQGWYYEYVDVDDSDSGGLWWNITLQTHDCKAQVSVNLYSSTNGSNDWMHDYQFDIGGPCIMPFDLLVWDETTTGWHSPVNLSAGTSNMSWDFSNLTGGYDYQFEWEWHTGSGGQWFSESFTSDGSGIGWNLTVGAWDCNVEVQGYLYNTSDGNWNQVMERHFHFEVPGCLALDLSLESEQDGQWEWAGDLDNGTNQMRWSITPGNDAAISGGFNYTLQWYVYRNGDMTDYDYLQWSGTDFMSMVDDADGLVFWNLTIDEFDTCELEIQGSLFASMHTAIGQTEGDWTHIAGLGEWYEFPCDEYGDYDPVIVSAHQNGTWVDDPESLDTGTTEMRLDFSDLDSGTQYYIEVNWYADGEGGDWTGFWFDPANTTEHLFNVSAGEWSCWVEVNYNLQMQNAFGWTDWMGSHGEQYPTPCTEGGDVDLESYDAGAWGSPDLANGTNELRWNLTSLAVGYDYALEWFVEFNNEGVSLYEYQLWAPSTSDEMVYWNLTIDNAIVCDVYIWARMMVDDSDSADGEVWHEVYYWGNSFWIENSTCVNQDPISLLVESDGNWTHDPGFLDAGSNQMMWDTSNLSIGMEYRIYWYWSSDDYDSQSQSLHFTADGSPIEWNLDVAMWSCGAYAYYDLHVPDFRGGEHWIDGESWDFDAPCQDVQYNGTQNATVELSLFQNGTWTLISNSTSFDEGTTPAMVNASMLEDGFEYYGQMEAYYDGNLNLFASRTWFADSESEISYDNLTIASFVCAVDIQLELYVRTPDGWNTVAYHEIYLSGPCDGTEGDAQMRMPLYADLASNGSWTPVDDNTTLQSGTTPMFWDMSTLDDGANYYIHFHADGQHVFSGYTDNTEYNDMFEDGYWNLTTDQFSCGADIWMNIQVLSEVTGWHSFGYNYIYPETECADGGDLGLQYEHNGAWVDLDQYEYLEIEAGTTQFQWSLTNLSTGYNYSLQWSQYINGYWQGEEQYEWYANSGSSDVNWNVTIDEFTCSVSAHAYLYIESPISGTNQVESFHIYPNGPCEPPFGLDSYHDNGTVSHDVEHLEGGTTQMLFDFSDMEPGTQYYVEYYWNTDSNYEGWFGEYVNVSNDTSGVWWNITLLETDCFVNLDVQLVNTTDGWNSWGSYHFDLTGPCASLFDLMEQAANGSWQSPGETIGTGANEMRWNLSNLVSGADYHIEWTVASQTIYDQYSSSFTADGSHIDWALDLSHWDCHVSIYAYLYEIENSSGNQSMNYADSQFYSFEVSPCVDAELELESYQDGAWGWHENLTDGTNDMMWNLSALETGFEYTLEWYVYRNGYLTDYDYQQWNASSDDEAVYWALELDESLTCDTEIWGRVYVWVPGTSGNNTSSYEWTYMDGVYEEYSHVCTESGTFDPVGVDAYQGGSWISDPELLDVGTNQMRLDFNDLDDGTQYYIAAYWSVPGNSSGYGYGSFWFDPASTPTYEFNITVGQWDCWAEVEYYLLLETVLGLSYLVGDYFHEFDTNCLGGEVDLSVEQGGTWVDEPFELANGTNDLMWNLTDLAVGYDYALEWAVWYNDYVILYDYEEWTSSSDAEALYWNIDIDDSVCDVHIAALMRVDVGSGNGSDPYTDINHYESSFSMNCTESGEFDALWLSALQDGTWNDDPENLTGGETEMAWVIEPINPDLDYSVYWFWDAYGSSGASFGDSGSATNVSGPSANWNISIPDWACWVDLHAELEAGPLLDGSYVMLDSSNHTLGAPCEDTTPTGNLTLYELDGGNWVEEPGYLADGTHEMHWNLTELDAGVEYFLSWTASMNGITLADESRSWIAVDTGSGETWNLTVPSWYCGIEVHAHLDANTSFGWISVEDRWSWLDTPCEGDILHFAEALESSAELFRDNESISLELTWVVDLNESIREMLDAYFGDGDGYLNYSESNTALAEIAVNGSDGSPMFQLNGQDPDWSEIAGPSFTDLPSSSFGLPMMEMTWVLHYENMYGLAFSTYIGLTDNDTDSFAFDVDVYFYGNEDFDLDSVYAHHFDNTSTPVGIANNEAHYSASSGDEIPLFEVVWDEVLPEPSLELLQWNPYAGDFGEPSNVTSWMDVTGAYEFEFRASASDLSWQNFTIEWDVWIDGEHY